MFVVQDGELLTPDLESGCLPGIAREAVLELARGAGIPTREEPLPRARLTACREVFLTNSAAGVVPVTRLDDRLIGAGRPGGMTVRLRDGYGDLVDRESR